MKKNPISRRVLSLILCLALVLPYLAFNPFRTEAAAFTKATANRITDPHTLDDWQRFFGMQENHGQNVSLTTEYAGGVWTDKSVFLPGQLPAQLTNATYNGNSISVADTGTNFVVALSAIASNKQIKGYSTIPTDTVLILDLSSSMRSTDDNGGSAVDELVEATNKAITDLLALNKNNRVAVVIYAGNVNRSFSAADGITQVVLPLDSYTTTTAGQYLLSRPVGRNQHYAIEVASGVKNTVGSAISANRFETSTGTYMQDGIYEAMKLLLNADPIVQDGIQAGTNRLPIMVLMTDGEPTMASSDYTGNDARTNLGDSDLYSYDGSTGTYTHRDTIAFMTSLTAAFSQKEIEAHYGKSPLMYTLPYGNAVMSRPEALSVLNPAQSSTVQNTLWNAFLDGQAVTVYRTGNRPNNYETITVRNSTLPGETLTAADRLYVDKYFPANNDDEMLNAFESIVDEIIIQSKYYPTYVESDHDHDGYLTFADKIGSYMELTDITGIVVGNRLFSGAALAKNFNTGSLGTIESPSALGRELILSIQTRLGIADHAVAQALMQNAFAHNQMHYVSDSDYEHYIGWFSDADGNYVDFWHKDMTQAQIDSAVANKKATHIIRSYGFLGDTTVIPGVSSTDMMFMSIRVATEIATGETILTWRIPASLVPTITYEVEVEVDSNNQITRLTGLTLENGTANAPIRLVYEVALRSDITDWNMSEKISSSYVAENGYNFYSNKWETDPEATSQNTYSHFEPSLQNERYYYTQDTVVLTKNGENYTPYTGAKPSGSGYYHAYQVFEKLENGTLRIHAHYEPITAAAMADVQASDNGQWVIPKDTVHRYYDYEITDKTQNPTATMAHSDHPFVVKSGNTYYTYSTHGNNGKLTLTPATGIRLTKSLAQGYSSQESFTFVISGDIGSAQVVRLTAEGEESSRTALPASGEVTLAAGETVYVIGLTAGSYTVTEQIPTGAGYVVDDVLIGGQSTGASSASVSLTAQRITDVEFINDRQGYGHLIVSKEVNYPEGFAPTDAHNQKDFTIQVAFDGNIDSIVAPQNAQLTGTTYTLTLKDGQSVTFQNIPEGTGYTVTETALPAGYVNTDIRYSNAQHAIGDTTTDQVHVVNGYQPAATTVDLEITGTKTVIGGWPTGAAFTVKLWEITDFASGAMKDTGLSAAVTEAQPSYSFNLAGISFPKAGNYHYVVVEEIPENRIPDMAYDRSYGMFTVTVTDTDADGQLEIASVFANQETAELSGDAANGYTVIKNFRNVVTKDIVYIDVLKQIVDSRNPDKTYQNNLADITFGLFTSQDSQTPAYFVLTDADGKATFAVPVTQAELGTEGVTYYLREIAPSVEDRVVGMHYDESWIGSFQITWDDTLHAAVTAYAPAEGTFAPYDRTQTQITHTNTYEPNVHSTPELLLSGNKTLNGSNDLGGRTFQFNLYETTAAFVIQGQPLQTVTSDGNVIAFSGITFTTPGMHYLSVKEAPTSLGGITIDENHYHITVLVEKYTDSEGTTRLRVADGYPHIVSYGSSEPVNADALNFHNRYTVTGSTSAIISGTKTLTGRPMQSGEFTFLLQQTDATGAALPGGLTLQAENGTATGQKATFQFAPIVFDTEGEYYYRVTEQAGAADNGITYSKASFLVKVTVADNNEGSLNATWSVVDGDAISFTNSYRPRSTFTDILSTKELSGKVLADGQFEFELLQTKDDFETAASGGIHKVVKNDAHGRIPFGRLNYTEEGTYYYVVREKTPAKPEPGITYDPTTYRITVRVVDDHKGSLESFVAMEMAEESDTGITTIPTSSIVFYNRYTVTGEALLNLEGTKELTGKPLADGAFTFQLYTTDDTYALEGLTPDTAVNENGQFRFEKRYTPEDAGKTFYYVLREMNGGSVIDGIVYDAAEYRLEVQVSDNGLGGLKLTCLVDGQETNLSTFRFAFTNRYEVAEGAEIVLGGTKELNGGTLTDGAFTFELYNATAEFTPETTTPVATAVNKDGAFDFRLQYTPADAGKTFYYLLREKNGGKTVGNIIYSDTVYRIRVDVADNGAGKLEVTSTVDGTAADLETFRFAFINTIKPPAVTPQTGDNMNLPLLFMMMLGSMTGMFVLLLGAKKEEKRKKA